MSNARTLRLSPAQVESYNREGYIVYDQPVLPQATFDRLLEIFEEDLDQYGYDGLDVIHFRDKRLLDIVLSDEILDLVEPVVGPDIGLWSTHFIAKPPKVGKATPWHEDSTYWNGRVSTMAGICTVWLALDRATKDNGCMAVIPGTHDNGFSQYIPVDTNQNIFPTEIDPTQIDESKAVYLELEPNRCSLHEGRIIHGAKPNTSDTRRAGYTIRFFPTTSKVFPERNQGHKIWLARGMDHAGNIYEN
ncbi:MAG: phytanoyl-CoA dioxygenase [Armatimonadetes bacterium 55-13]|nr:phytanoyl-CoA dioxygenase family protein [Armatimonadota bacterium]OJU64053.1 MAG: phytanoyl-CoA dioxygenase [Armatimonadetes bacterium 55-13]